MSRTPDMLCAGCSKPMQRGRTSLPPGRARCQGCRHLALAPCRFCGAEFQPVRVRGKATEACSRSCAQKLRVIREGRYLGRDPEKLKANYRARNYRRRAARRRIGDVTKEYERSLRVKAKRCPLCDVKLSDAPYLPDSKELDHIVPVNMGGTHTIGNVRVICRLCNQKRPKDGSDFIGQPTLWAQDPDVMPKLVRVKRVEPPKVERVRKPAPAKPQPRPCKTCGIEITPEGRGRPRSWCEDCRPSEYLRRKTAA